MRKDEYENTSKYYDYFISPLLVLLRKRLVKYVFFEAKKNKKVFNRKTVKNINLLEIACGTGLQSIEFAKKGFKTTGIDISKNMLKRASSNVRNKKNVDLKFVEMDATNLLFKDNLFDICSISFAIHEMVHLTRIDIIKELHRVIKKDGLIFLVDYNEKKNKSISQLFMVLIEKMAGKRHYANYLHFMKNGGVVNYFDNNLFELVEQKYILTKNVVLYVFQKKK